MTYSKVFIRDMLERAASTFVQTFAAVLVAGAALDVSALKAAAVAGIFAILKAVASEKLLPGTLSPASLVKR